MDKKVLQWMGEYRVWIAVTAIGAVIWMTICFCMLSGDTKSILNHNEAALTALQAELDIVEETYKNFSEYVFRQVLNQPEVTALLAEAGNADEAGKAVLRHQLYEQMGNAYDRLKTFEFRQLHFHLADGESFLRFSEPDKFGDNLFPVRETVRVANTERRAVYGFEEGRTNNGYRCVYPLFHQGTHIGSVEVSLSMASFMEVMYELFPMREMYYIVRQDMVKETVFDTSFTGYVPSDFSDDYLYDKAILESMRSLRAVTQITPEMAKMIRRQAEGALKKDSSFSIAISYEGKDYMVQFLRIDNYSGDALGYFVALSRDEEYAALKKSSRLDLVLVTLLFLLFTFSTYNYAKSKARFKELSSRDSLTSVLNRRSLMQRLDRELVRYRQYGDPFSVIMLDVDNFKGINDTWGHQGGDDVLKGLALRVQRVLRKQDVLSRWGGDEFLILLPQTDIAGTMKVAEKIRETVAVVPLHELVFVTISLGVAGYSGTGTVEELIAHADENMYKAKESGKNCICGQ